MHHVFENGQENEELKAKLEQAMADIARLKQVQSPGRHGNQPMSSQKTPPPAKKGGEDLAAGSTTATPNSKDTTPAPSPREAAMTMTPQAAPDLQSPPVTPVANSTKKREAAEQSEPKQSQKAPPLAEDCFVSRFLEKDRPCRLSAGRRVGRSCDGAPQASV